MKAPKFIVEVQGVEAEEKPDLRDVILYALEREFAFKENPVEVTVKVVNAAAVQKLASEWS